MDAHESPRPHRGFPTHGRVLEFRRPTSSSPDARRPSAGDPLWRELAGARLRERRRQQDRTLGDVARRAGISPQYLSEIERGRKDPSSEMLASICGALGVDLADLLRDSIIRLGSGISAPTGHRPPQGPVLMAV